MFSSYSFKILIFHTYNVILILLFFACAAARAEVPVVEFTFPATGITVKDQAALLAIDDYSLPFKKDLCFYLSKPKVRKEPVLVPSRNDPNSPDYLGACFYGTVLFDSGRFRMWYYALHSDQAKKGLIQGPICYAQSDDGIKWNKPALGLVLLNGSRNNNALALPDTKGTEGVTVIKDDIEPDPNRRYKMAYNEWSTRKGVLFTIRTATSTDGIHWTAGREVPLGSFIEHASFYKYDNCYFINGQTYDRSEGGDFGGRQAYVRISPDFENWLPEPAQSFMLSEPAKNRGIIGNYKQVHLGVGAAPFGNVLVGLYGMWNQKGWGIGGTTCDLGLVVSNDGIHFREPVKDYVYISRNDSPVTSIPGKDYPTILAQANGILNVGDETRIYHGRWRNVSDEAPLQDIYDEIALATLPRDRWGSIGLIPPLAGHSSTPEGAVEGSVWSAAVKLPPGGCSVYLNADGADCMTVEVSDERFTPIPDFSGQKSGVTTIKSGLDCPVTWYGRNLSALGGQTVRFRIHLTKRNSGSEPRLFAVYLRK
jgi:hypothetical protein